MRIPVFLSSIRGRLLLITGVCLFMTFSGMLAVRIFGLPHGLLAGGWRQQEHDAFARLGAVADTKKAMLAHWFQERLADLELAGQNPLLADFLAGQMAAGGAQGPDGSGGGRRRQEGLLAWLQTLRRLNSDYDYIELVEEGQGRILLSTDPKRPGTSLAFPEELRLDALRPGEVFVFFVRAPETIKAYLCLAIHLPALRQGASSAALVFSIETSALAGNLRDTALPGVSGEIFFVDRHQVLLSPLRYPLPSGAPGIPLQTKLGAKMEESAAWGNDGILQAADYRGVQVVSAVRHLRLLPDFGLGMVVKQDRAEVMAPIYRSLVALVGIAFSGLVVMLVAIFCLARSLLKPVEQVTAAARRLREGDLAARALETGSGEALVLAAAFNGMASEVQLWSERLQAQVQERTAELITANQKLQGSETWLQAILDNLADAIAVLKEGRHVYANSAYLRLFGYALVEELCGRFIFDIIAQQYQEKTLDFILARTPGGETPVSLETKGCRRNGETMDLDLRVATFDLAGEAHKLLIFRGIMRGLTELKTTQDDLLRKNEELRERTNQLQAVNAELESFNYTVAHDLRAPIRSLAGFPDLLQSHLGELLDDKGRQYLEAIRTASRRMSEITTDLLNFSRLGRVEIQMTDVDLNLLVSKVREDLASMAGGRQVEWQVSELPVVKGDANLLRIAVNNLLANALKFTLRQEVARIAITVSADDSGLPVLTVRDNGAGFDMRYADRLFKIFSRLHTADEFEGTGIGLATVNRIIRRHGGKIWAEGRPGAGAAFSFTLAPGGVAQ